MIDLYKITNKINGKIYIGQTRNIIWRWYWHCYCAERVNNKMAIDCAIKKYGPDVFSMKILRSFSNQIDANIAEINTIKYWRYKGPTYNISDGGENGGNYALGDRF